MTELKKIISPTGREFTIPEGVSPEAERFARETITRADIEFRESTYGHAAIGMVNTVFGDAVLGATPEEQQERLRNLALRNVKKFGPNIIPLLRDELQLALTEEDLASLGL